MLTTTIVLFILYLIYRWSVAWINYYNNLDKRFGMSVWRYSYDYHVAGKRDVSFLDDKKLDFDIWLNPKEGIIFKVKYNRLGSWEYRLKNYE